MTSRDLQDLQPSPQSTDGQPYAATEVETSRRKRGAPSGKQNARKHGFYAIALSPQEQETLQETVNLKGLGSEIALMRMVAVQDQVTYH